MDFAKDHKSSLGAAVEIEQTKGEIAMRTEKISIGGSSTGVTLTSYLLDTCAEYRVKRPGILILPGGGYSYCSDREAEPVAMAFLSEGFHAFVLRYSCANRSVWPAPLRDAEKAMRILQKNAEEWLLDIGKIAVAGFSAGGHLAAALGTMGKLRPNAMILGYPCILQSLSSLMATPMPGLDTEVDEHTPPAFLFTTYEDQVVPVQNSLSFLSALNAWHIPFEAHIFQKGGHGLSLAKAVTAVGREGYVNEDVAQWFPMCVRWLGHLFNEPQPEEHPIPTAQQLGRYGADVQIASVWDNEDCRRLMLEAFPMLSDRNLLEMMAHHSLEEANGSLPARLQVPGELLSLLHSRLCAIPLMG